MSGGSFNYLCREFCDLFPPDTLREMAQELAPGSPEREATEHVTDLFRQIREEADALHDVWKAVEWVRSCDWGQERIDHAIVEFRSLSNLCQSSPLTQTSTDECSVRGQISQLAIADGSENEEEPEKKPEKLPERCQ